MKDKGTDTRYPSNRTTPKVVRDLSESLGKLPPQAVEMEEAVLGAIMLEKDAIDKVPFLKENHFYNETHREIFAAICKLRLDKKPIDSRLVISQLRSSGKLELVGGMFAIAELTRNVSSAANIEFHGRVIVEASMKRDVISIASKIHQDSYEDTSDIISILEKNIEELQFLKERETKTSGPERIKKLWESTMVTVKPPDQFPLITLDGSPVCTPGNHSLLVGKKKSRKTLFITYLIGVFLNDKKNIAEEVLLFDTEQGRSHVWKVREKIYKLTDQYCPIFYLRGMAPKERRDFIQETIKHWPTPPKIVVIDGIRDLMSNINDPDESTEVIVWLEKITLTHNVNVINILHLNKTDGNARGHIGSELLNKAEVTIQLELDEKTGVTIVKCESSRERPFASFAFTHGVNDLPELVDVPISGTVIPSEDKLRRLNIIFEEGPLKREDFIKALKAHFSCGANKAGSLIAEFQRVGWVIKGGKDRSPDAVYKLLTAIDSIKAPVKAVSSELNELKPDEPEPELPF